jgi:hypothetical protein
MGRYYYGDIEGKFWFGVQSSFDADNLGVKHTEEYIDKCKFCSECIDDIENVDGDCPDYNEEEDCYEFDDEEENKNYIKSNGKHKWEKNMECVIWEFNDLLDLKKYIIVYEYKYLHNTQDNRSLKDRRTLLANRTWMLT